MTEAMLSANANEILGPKETFKTDTVGGSMVYVTAGAKGDKVITLLGNSASGEGDEVYIDAKRGANVTVTGGAGKDTLVVRDNASVVFDMGKGGADEIYLATDEARENVTLKNYNDANGGGIVLGNASDTALINAIEGGKAIIFGDGVVEINGTTGKGTVEFASHTGNSGQTVFNILDENLTTEELYSRKVAFTNSDGGKIDVSSKGDAYIMVGNYHDNKDGSSSLLGGKGNDTILAGAGDVINADGGENLIRFKEGDTSRSGAEVIIASGTTTVQNAHNGYDEGGDVINIDVTKLSLSVVNDGLVVSGSGTHATVEGVGDNGVVKQLIKTGGNTYKAAIAAEGTEITVSDGDDIANYYQGGSVNFTGYSDSVKADLSGATESGIDGGVALFNGVNVLYAGSGNTEFRGSKGNDTLYAGTGNTSMYGGAGRNYLANSATEKDGSTSFFVLSEADGAHNTISGFEFLQSGSDNNFGTADRMQVGTANGNRVSNVYIKNTNDVVITVTNSAGTQSETALIEGAVGQDMIFNETVVAQVNATTLNYDGTANYFVATENNAAINVNSDVVAPVSIWLDVPAWAGTKENTFKGDIRTIDASSSSVKAELAGNDANNTIYAGSGNTSLWGGNGGDDFMQGGAGVDNFYYTYGNGDDTISGTSTGDTVFLTQVGIDQISGASFEGSTATLNFTDGGKLTIKDAANANYVVTQGEEMRTYRVENGAFVQN